MANRGIEIFRIMSNSKEILKVCNNENIEEVRLEIKILNLPALK